MLLNMTHLPCNMHSKVEVLPVKKHALFSTLGSSLEKKNMSGARDLKIIHTGELCTNDHPISCHCLDFGILFHV